MRRRLLALSTTVGLIAAALAATAPARADDDDGMPTGDLPGWHQTFADDFSGQNVPVGSFSDCDHDADTPDAYCAGLPEPYRSRYWAYPDDWPDTAKQRGYPLGGTYDPEHTISISPASDGDGQMHVKLYRGASGENHVAAVVPKAAMDQKYGRYAIRFKAGTTPGYKLAWLLWPTVNDAGSEIDFPELELDSTISAFMHYRDGSGQDAFDTGQPYGVWHTAVTEWGPGDVKFYLDDKLVGHSTKLVPDTSMSWIIQSESALDERAEDGSVIAAPNSSATIDISWIAAYSREE